MPNGVLLEICAESLECAEIAVSRAQRVELCTDLAGEGTTPSAGLMQAARQRIDLPIHVLIRPRRGNFFYSEVEFQVMRRDIEFAKQLGMDGVVIGLLDREARVDVERTARLVEASDPLPVTFHRAFDLCHDLDQSLEAVIQTGARRILTSGGRPSAVQGIANLRRLIEAADSRIVIMPGGGIRADNVTQVVEKTGAREIHTSLSVSSAGLNPAAMPCDPAEFEQRVRTFRSLLDRLA